MCGLVGVVTKGIHGFQAREIDVFTQLLYADQVRGSHGTGMFYNSKQGKPHIRTLKAPCPSSAFIGFKEYEEATRTLFKESNFVVGHNRSATKGKIDTACTHPFREKHIVLVHNGTLLSHKNLKEDVEVDSHAICHSIAEIGIKETTKKLDGAFALIWFDAKEKTLNLCRNIQRPLFILDFGSCFVFCSELGLGLWVGSRNGLILLKTHEVAPKTLYKFHLNNMTKWEEEPLEYLVFQFKQGDNGNYYGSKFCNEGNAWTKPGKSQRNGKSFSFGEKIRFRSGVSIHTRGKSDSIEGDILKYQYLNETVEPKPSDFEDEYRIIVYGGRDYLSKRLNKNNLIGVVISSVIKGGVTYYTVSQVEEKEIKSSNVIALPSIPTPAKSSDKKKCDWCSEEFNTLNFVNGEYLCDDCDKYSLGMYGRTQGD